MEDNNIINKKLEEENVAKKEMEALDEEGIKDEKEIEKIILDDEKRTQIRDYILTHMDDYSREAMEKSLLDSKISQEDMDAIFEELGFKKEIEKKSSKTVYVILALLLTLGLIGFFVYYYFFLI
ncbi:MAG: hypothetical protein KC589_00420 [Nanoarchaeota archaeon]|nr:hypothetical protein [Nanoarchaeota archaeon]